MKKLLILIMGLFSLIVHAQDAGPESLGTTGAPEAPSALVQFTPFILIFFIFYFLMIRPQKKRMDEENKLLAALSKGDEIYTKAGILGTITGVTEKVITLEIAEGVKMKVLKSQVAGLAKKLFETTQVPPKEIKQK